MSRFAQIKYKNIELSQLNSELGLSEVNLVSRIQNPNDGAPQSVSLREKIVSFLDSPESASLVQDEVADVSAFFERTNIVLTRRIKIALQESFFIAALRELLRANIPISQGIVNAFAQNAAPSFLAHLFITYFRIHKMSLAGVQEQITFLESLVAPNSLLTDETEMACEIACNVLYEYWNHKAREGRIALFQNKSSEESLRIIEALQLFIDGDSQQLALASLCVPGSGLMKILKKHGLLKNGRLNVQALITIENGSTLKNPAFIYPQHFRSNELQQQ